VAAVLAAWWGSKLPPPNGLPSQWSCMMCQTMKAKAIIPVARWSV